MDYQAPDPPARSLEFVVLLRDEDDAKGLAQLLEDVRAPGRESLGVFSAPRLRGSEYLSLEAESPAAPAPGDGARRRERVLLLQNEPGLADLITDRDTFYIGVEDEHDADRYGDRPNVIAFRATGPLDFAAEVMDRFSGPRATPALFDADEAARMRALTDDFPIELEEATEPGRELLRQGMGLFGEERFAEALSAFDQALASEPGWSEAQIWRGYALQRIVEELLARGVPAEDERRQALEAFRAALAADHPNPHEAGNGLLDLGDPEGAADAYRRALELDPNAAWLHKSLGTALTLDEDLPERFQLGEKEFTTALELDPGDAATWRSRGVIRINLCRYDDALTDLDRAQRLDIAGDPVIHMFRAIALSAQGRLREARSAAARAARLGAGHDRQRWIEYVHAGILLQLEDLAPAEAALKNAERIAVESNDFELIAKVKASAGVLFARQGRLHEGLAACHSSIEHAPTEPVAFATLAWISKAMGRLDEAGDAIGQSVSRVETNRDWSNRCQYVGAKWPFYVMQASILNALSERDADDRLAEYAVGATQKAWKDFHASHGDHPPADRERGAQIFLERAYAHFLCNRPGQVSAALREGQALAPPDSTPWRIATRALRDRPPAPLKIETSAIIATETLTLTGATALLISGELGSGPFVLLVLGLLALGLVAYAFPFLTRLRLGRWVEFEKAVVITDRQAMQRLDVPLSPPPIEVPKPQVSQPSVVNKVSLRWPSQSTTDGRSPADEP